MEELRLRLMTALKALARLKEVLAERPSEIVQDATIQRFEFTFEATWKVLQRYLTVQEGLEVGSPRQTIRQAFAAGLIDEPTSRALMEVLHDRNLTVHIYDEERADEIFRRIPGHAEAMGTVILEIEKRLPQ